MLDNGCVSSRYIVSLVTLILVATHNMDSLVQRHFGILEEQIIFLSYYYYNIRLLVFGSETTQLCCSIKKTGMTLTNTENSDVNQCHLGLTLHILM